MCDVTEAFFELSDLKNPHMAFEKIFTFLPVSKKVIPVHFCHFGFSAWIDQKLLF